MSSLKVLAVAGTVVLGAATSAFAGDLPLPPPAPSYDAPLRGTVSAGGVYLRGDIGVGITNIGKYSVPDLAAIPSTQYFGHEHPTPTFVGLGIGYRFNNWFRADVTGEYRAKSAIGVTDSFTNPGNPAGVPAVAPFPQTNTYKGSLSSTVVLANAYVDLGTFCALGCLTPFVGAGIGFANNTVGSLTDQGVQLVGAGPASPTLGYARSTSKTGLAWALHAGVGYQVNQNLTLELAYRYLNLGKAQSGPLTNAFNGQVQGPLKLDNIDSHDIKIGMRWALNGDCCAAIAPEPVFAPAPMVRKF
jgi:opacity protein-like surface antigen